MKDEYAPRVCVPLREGTVVEHPEEMPELVHMHDPAEMACIDFTRVKPLLVTAGVSIDDAYITMREAGACVALVTDTEGAVAGLLTGQACSGDRPVRMAQSDRVPHSEIRVEMVMMPRADLRVMEWSHMEGAQVGHIVATLHQLESDHLLVVDQGRVRGMFTAGQIARQLGHAVTDEALPAHSLAEIVHTLG